MFPKVHGAPPSFLILSYPSPQPVVTVVTKDCEALLKQEVVGPQGVGSGVTCGVLVPWEPVWTGAPPFTAGDEAGWMGHQQSSAGPAPGDPSPRPALPSAGGVRPPALWGAVQDPAPPAPASRRCSRPSHAWPPAREFRVSCFLWHSAGHVVGIPRGLSG